MKHTFRTWTACAALLPLTMAWAQAQPPQGESNDARQQLRDRIRQRVEQRSNEPQQSGGQTQQRYSRPQGTPNQSSNQAPSQQRAEQQFRQIPQQQSQPSQVRSNNEPSGNTDRPGREELLNRLRQQRANQPSDSSNEPSNNQPRTTTRATPRSTGQSNQDTPSSNQSDRAEALRRLRQQQSTTDDKPADQTPASRDSAQDRLQQLRNRQQQATGDDKPAERTPSTPQSTRDRLQQLRDRQQQATTDDKPSDDAPAAPQSTRDRLQQLRDRQQQATTDDKPSDDAPATPQSTRDRLQQLRDRQQQATDDKPSDDAPATPQSTRDRLQQLRDRQQQATTDDKPSDDAPATPQSTRDRLQQLRDRQQGEQASGEKPAEEPADMKSRLENFRKEREESQVKAEQRIDAFNSEEAKTERTRNQERLKEFAQQRREGGDQSQAEKANSNLLDSIKNRLPENQREELTKRMGDESTSKNPRDFANMLRQVRGGDDTDPQTARLDKRVQKGRLIGEDVDIDSLRKLGIGGRKFSQEDSKDRFRNIIDDYKDGRVKANDNEIAEFRQGLVPDRFRRNFKGGDEYNVINIGEINIENNYYGGGWHGWGNKKYKGDDWWDNINVGVNIGGGGYGLAFNYYDGRSYYNHDYALSIFVNVGHVRYGGYDGCYYGGRYYSYGWGYIDGCIDYGGCRMWVPGFWAPYTTQECGSWQVWIPPAYEWVWTGCCWEQVQVDGGYFRTEYGDCRNITRYTWVPGHYQRYYC